jgi:hypothetical protein
MMGKNMPETCWDIDKQEIKSTVTWHLVGIYPHLTLAIFLVFMKHTVLLQRPFFRTYPEQMNSVFFLTPRLFTYHFYVGLPSRTFPLSFLLFDGINISLGAWYTFVFWFSYSLKTISLSVYAALICVLSQTHTKAAYSQTCKRTK